MIQELLDSANGDKVKELFVAKKPSFKVTTEEAISQYDVLKHDVFDNSKRPDKIIKKDTGEVDGSGEHIYAAAVVPVSRVGVPFQDLIVERRVGFMLSDPAKVEAVYPTETPGAKEEALVSAVKKLLDDNKMDYRDKEVARRLMSEMECAEIWYFVPTQDKKQKFTMKMKIVSPVLGDSLYPLYDDTGDMIAFARGYKTIVDSRDVEHLDVFTPLAEYRFINVDNTWSLDTLLDAEGKGLPNPIPNAVGKIMVVYHSQIAPEWIKVQAMIGRLEEIYSNHADMNDYFGSPILAVFGEVIGFAQKGEQGKILELSENAKANYLALSSPPESIKMEIENLKDFIYTMSQTPNISLDNVKGLGSLSGIALKLMFLDAHLAVYQKEEIFSMGLQRRLNLLKSSVGMVIDTTLKDASGTVRLKPVITPYLPQNMTELIDNLSVSVSSGIMSRETAIEVNSLVPDPKVELKRIQEDNTNQLQP